MDIRLVGIDGGGTKTDAVLCAGDGTVLSRKIGDASSPTSRTLEEAEGCILGILEELLDVYKRQLQYHPSHLVWHVAKRIAHGAHRLSSFAQAHAGTSVFFHDDFLHHAL